MSNTQKLIERLEQILPGLQNSNSAAEVAMVEALPEVIATLKSYSAPALHRLMAERDAMAEALAEAASELRASFEALGEFANTLSREPYEANRAYAAFADARKALERT
jgi:hypothetical protein